MQIEFQQKSVFPDRLLFVLAAGGIAELVLEFIAWWIAPALLGRPMRPDILVGDFARTVFSADVSTVFAVSIHLALGLLIFPLIYLTARKLFGFRGKWLPAIVYGIALWAVAQMVLAPLAGRPFMLGLIPYTWFSLFAHVVYTVVFALAFEKLTIRSSKASH